jgi:hypothetical protein
MLKYISQFPAEAASAWIGVRRRPGVVDDVAPLNGQVILANEPIWESNSIRLNPTKSDRVKPGQTQSNQFYQRL